MIIKTFRLFVILLIFSCSSSTLFGAVKTEPDGLEPNQFCAACHPNEAEAISREGLSHATEVSCSNCHHGHKPKSFENIPACNLCHSGTAHYDQLQCLNCHRDPHRPMIIKLPKKAHDECLTCHERQGVELSQHQSYHSQLVCTDCHYDHGFLPECMSCHRAHGSEMTESDCQSCHAPHKPLEMAFTSSEVPTSFCSPCHQQAGNLLAGSQRKHRDLSCVKCHEQHGSITDCRSCHGKPHVEAMHVKFPSCGECHGIAHDLQ